MLLLIIDDDHDFVTVWRHILATEGFDVAAVVNIENARSFIHRKRPDAILCDANIADLNMSEFCKDLAAGQNSPHIPVIIAGELGETKKRDLFLKDGAVEYIAKPFKRETLLELLKSLSSAARRANFQYNRTNLNNHISYFGQA